MCRVCERRELIARTNRETVKAKSKPTDIRLKRIDLNKGDKSHHPDIKTDGTQYLIKHNQEYYAGTFEEQWYGLNFNEWGNSGLQYDKPGTNSSNWQGVWEIVEAKRKRNEVKRCE